MFVPTPVSYSISDDDEVGRLAEKLSFLPAAALGHFIRSLKPPGVNQFIPVEKLVGDGWYVPTCENARRHANKAPHITERLVKSPAVWLPRLQYFANGLRYGDGVPSMRVVNVGWYVHAYEIDGGHYEAALAEQFLWAFGDEEEPAPLMRLVDRFREFRDFRRAQLVWSGNRSAHLFLYFDTRGLAASRFLCRKFDRANDPDLPDLPEERLRGGFIEHWHRGKELVREVLRPTEPFDEALRYPEMWRRFPNGLRLIDEHAKKKDKIGFEIGDRVPQVVLFDHAVERSRGSEFFHVPAEFMRQKAAPTRPKSRPVGAMVAAGELHEFVEYLAAVCATQWGDLDTHPTPVIAEYDGQGFRVLFRNDAADGNPASVMRSGFEWLHFQGTQRHHVGHKYKLPKPVDEMLAEWQAARALATLAESHLRFDERWFRYKATSPEAMRAMLPRAMEGTARSKLTAFLTPQGATKSSTALRAVPVIVASESTDTFWRYPQATREWVRGYSRRHPFDCISRNPGSRWPQPLKNGLDFPLQRSVVYACPQWQHVEEKMEEFRRLKPDWEPVKLPSFQHAYEIALAGRPPMTFQEVVASGCETRMEAVLTSPDDAEGPTTSAADALLGMRREFLERCSRHPRIVFFTVKEVVTGWHRNGGARVLWHPLFMEWLLSRRNGDLQEARWAAEKIRETSQIAHVIFDELNLDDLRSMHRWEDVEWAHGVCDMVRREHGKGWYEVPLRGRYDAYLAVQCAQPRRVAFEETQGIIDIGYEETDRIVPDPDRETFGDHGGNNPYRAASATKWGAKTRRWFLDGGYALTCLTTERRAFNALRWINAKLRAEAQEAAVQDGRSPYEERYRDRYFNLFDLDAVSAMPVETRLVELRKDKLARAKATVHPDQADVVILGRQYLKENPTGVFVSNKASLLEGAITIPRAKGSNEFIGRPLGLALLYVNIEHYARLLVDGQLFGWTDSVAQYYVDEFDQTCGRVLGMRWQPGASATLVISPRLWAEIGTHILTRARYRVATTTVGGSSDGGPRYADMEEMETWMTSVPDINGGGLHPSRQN